MAQTEHIDPTGFGLLLVAALCLPIALEMLVKGDFSNNASSLASIIGFLLLIVAGLAYKANSNFGMTVFGLVGLGVISVGGGNVIFGMADIGLGGLIIFGIMYVACVGWSIVAKTPKLLTALLVTTALIFLLSGIDIMIDTDLATVIGVVYLINGILCAWLGAGLCCDKIPTF